MTDSASSPARDRVPRPLAGRRVAGGAESRRRFAEWLGLEGAEPGVRVTAVGWIDDHLELAITAGNDPLILCVEERVSGRGYFLVTDQLALWFHGAAVPAVVEDAVRHHAPSGLGDRSLAALREVLLADPELGRPGLPMPARDDYDSPTRGHLHSWGGAEVYADFFARAELIRHQLDSLDLFLRTTSVQHADLECMCVAPVHQVPIVGLVNFPWGDRFRRAGRVAAAPADGVESGESPAAGVWTTALSERDVLLGGLSKLERVLRGAIANPQGGMILCSNTCVPVVTGEDVESVVKRARAESPVPLLYLTVTSASMRDVMSEVLTKRRLEAEVDAPPPDPAAVNLIGFPKSRATQELAGILEEAGVRVNAVLIPEVDPTVATRLHRAAVNVFWPNDLWENLYAQVRQESRIPSLSIGAPVGMEGSLGWLRAVGEAVGRGDPVAEVAERRAAALASRLADLTRDAGTYRLCLVARSSQIELLVDPPRSWGIPLIEVLESMGFGLDVFLHVRGREDARGAARAVHERFRRPEAHRLQAFETQAQMERRLGESQAAAVFTQHFFDWRVTSAGKAPFSLMHFEHGLLGAVSTLERLLGICRTGFFGRYGRYLGRLPDGRRRPIGASAPRGFTGGGARGGSA